MSPRSEATRGRRAAPSGCRSVRGRFDSTTLERGSESWSCGSGPCDDDAPVAACRDPGWLGSAIPDAHRVPAEIGTDPTTGDVAPPPVTGPDIHGGGLDLGPTDEKDHRDAERRGMPVSGPPPTRTLASAGRSDSR